MTRLHAVSRTVDVSPDLDAHCATLRSLHTPGAPLMFGLRDPDGNHVFVVEQPPAT